jgi:hypothetical protein
MAKKKAVSQKACGLRLLKSMPIAMFGCSHQIGALASVFRVYLPSLSGS